MVLTKLLQERVLKHLNFEEVNLTTRLKQSFSMHNCKQTYSDKIGHCRYEIPSPRRIAATDKHSHGSHMEVTWKSHERACTVWRRIREFVKCLI